MKWLRVGALVTLVSCGGIAVVDDSGSGGTNTTSGPVTTTSTKAAATTKAATASTKATTTGVDCASLKQAFDKVFEEATACNPCLAFDPCGNGGTIPDQCGCPIPATSDGLAQQAGSAFMAWAAAGCGPLECNQPCAPAGFGAFCAQVGEGCLGRCVNGAPD